MNKEMIETSADKEIIQSLDSCQNFTVIAGAGSGKTTSLISALSYLRGKYKTPFRRDGKKIVCVTYTERAKQVILERLNWEEDLFQVSTLHSFLWGEISRFQISIRDALIKQVIPDKILKKQEDDNGGQSIKAREARETIKKLQVALKKIPEVKKIIYHDSKFSNFEEGKIGHNDVITVASWLISNQEVLRKVIAQKYPYIFIDEAQDTFISVMEAFNKICEEPGYPVLGYFGDPLQQIYDDDRAGNFFGPVGYKPIRKEENFRCSPEVINLLNIFRNDIDQFPAGKNKSYKGSVKLTLIKREGPEGARNTYTDQQAESCVKKFESIIDSWGWSNESDEVKILFLARKMIARRLGFIEIHNLFTGDYASSKAQEDYESGEHRLLLPLIKVVYPIVKFNKTGDMRSAVKSLYLNCLAFNPEGINTKKSIKEIQKLASKIINKLVELWDTESIGSILKFCEKEGLCDLHPLVIDDLNREPMTGDFHEEDKSLWLADNFFKMKSSEIEKYCQFIEDKTPFSTQHGVKGEEYSNVVVIFDDVEAAWHKYNFSKILTPQTSGEATDGQKDRSRKLAYVCFSRAEMNLRIILFTSDPEKSKEELIKAKLFAKEQIQIDSVESNQE